MRTVPRLALVFLCVLLVVTPAAAAQEDGPRTTAASFQGAGVAGVDGNTTYVWQSGPHELAATVANHESSVHHTLCVETDAPDGNVTELGCAAIVDNGTNTVTFDQWPSSDLGRQNVTITIRQTANKSHVADTRTLEVYVLQKAGDPDGDTLSNAREAELGTQFLSSDSDEDGIPDGPEVTTFGTDPLSNDTDGDGLRDNAEVSVGTNATVEDSDGDGLLDGQEVNEYGTDPLDEDSDGDGLLDGQEVNEYGSDPLSEDSDDDGLLDGQEVDEYGTNASNEDSDDDGLLDGQEVNEYGTDPLDEDTDGDGLLDGPEVDEHGTDPLDEDTDGDGLLDGPEVDEHGTNPLVVDSDGDFLGDSTEASVGTWPTSPMDSIALAVVVLVGAGIVFRRPLYAVVIEKLPAPPVDDPVQRVVEGESVPERRPSPSAPVEGVESEILTDEDRVLKLLQEYSGPMPQKRVAEQTDWSASKVSRLLSRMDEEGTITKITIGRENIIKLADEDAENVRQRG
ncbi:DUF7343 domain-containing protein [Haloarchaeobius sp. HRN-SO-5]|uniref:helix-turn-helix transcriptional regulator n=1 Tax=Haloarchaeobius sp. HRN-SO-5 TaxID=3446118 RepID=UPI003EB9578E